MMESSVGSQVQMLQEGVRYLQAAHEMFTRPTVQPGESTGDLHPLEERMIARLERSSEEITEEFRRR